MLRRCRLLPLLWLLCLALAALGQTGPRFEVTFPASVHAQPITGRVFLVLARTSTPEPRQQIGFWLQRTPFLGLDVDQLKPGQAAIIDASALGFPFRSLDGLPAGDYHVQALLNVYTQVHRADGRTIWVHMDQWEGQEFNRSPGNLYSDPQPVHFDPKSSQTVRLELNRVIPPINFPADTPWVKHIKVQSRLLTQFWGHPIYVGATVLLPRDYDAHPNVRYPVVYIQGHFSLHAPFGFAEGEGNDGGTPRMREFTDAWKSASFPRMIAVTLQHPTPYFDDSYAVNSANDGPYGDALLNELVPYLEEHFRIIRQPWARVLTGGSTGGWESLALQILHPDFFGGTWTFFPDPIDFRRWQLVNIYEDTNAFVPPRLQPPVPERPMMRTAEGQPLMTMREMSLFEEVLGSHGRSGQQFEAWEAAYGPIGPDGYPKPLFNKLTGEIDPSVAEYMRDHGYDLRYYVEQNWAKLGPQLTGKIHLYCGDMDNFYLNLAVYKMEDFLNNAANPPANATVEYGRPMKGHGWMPMSTADLVRQMGEFITKHAPAGADTSVWKY